MSKYQRSPIYLAGRKYKLLEQIIPLFPQHINIFVDVFVGTGDVLLNVDANAYVANDKLETMTSMLKNIKEVDNLEDIISAEMKEFGAVKNVFTNDQFLAYRTYHNNKEDRLTSCPGIFILMASAFASQIRVNSSGHFNNTFGKRGANSQFLGNIKKARQILRNKNIEFLNVDFEEIPIFKDEFYYLDPPYINTVANYNIGWSMTDEIRFREFVVSISKEVKFALSNDLTPNPTIADWAQDNGFNIAYLNTSYKNAISGERKDKGVAKEVLITNYEN